MHSYVVIGKVTITLHILLIVQDHTIIPRCKVRGTEWTHVLRVLSHLSIVLLVRWSRGLQTHFHCSIYNLAKWLSNFCLPMEPNGPHACLLWTISFHKINRHAKTSICVSLDTIISSSKTNCIFLFSTHFCKRQGYTTYSCIIAYSADLDAFMLVITIRGVWAPLHEIITGHIYMYFTMTESKMHTKNEKRYKDFPTIYLTNFAIWSEISIENQRTCT